MLSACLRVFFCEIYAQGMGVTAGQFIGALIYFIVYQRLLVEFLWIVNDSEIHRDWVNSVIKQTFFLRGYFLRILLAIKGRSL